MNMVINHTFVIAFLALSDCFLPTLTTISHSVPLSQNGDTCNVVNLNCGSGQPQQGQNAVDRRPGAPGKVGPAGPKGSKGGKGDQGPVGEKGRAQDLMETQIKMAQMMAVSDCRELKTRFGVTTPGYYLMKSPESHNVISVYCDFQIYEGVSTCHELKESHRISKSGMYTFLPVGLQSPYDVFCNFEAGRVITEIWHDEMVEVGNSRTYSCEGNRGCYSWIPRYKVPATEILTVVTKSTYCRQFIKARCQRLLFGGYSWWVSREGEKMDYWGGGRTTGYCACGYSGSCVNKAKKCNCDTNNDQITTDEGYLTDKSKLPVSEIKMGDVDDRGEHVWHRLGKLECWNY